MAPEVEVIVERARFRVGSFRTNVALGDVVEVRDDVAAEQLRAGTVKLHGKGARKSADEAAKALAEEQAKLDAAAEEKRLADEAAKAPTADADAPAVTSDTVTPPTVADADAPKPSEGLDKKALLEALKARGLKHPDDFDSRWGVTRLAGALDAAAGNQ